MRLIARGVRLDWVNANIRQPACHFSCSDIGALAGGERAEAALPRLAISPKTAVTHLVGLPHRAWEGRACRALRIGKGDSADRRGIYLLGGVHALESGSPDILINFARLLTHAY